MNPAGSSVAAAMMVGAKKKQQSTKNSGCNSDGNGVRNNLIYTAFFDTAFFEQSIPVWNRLSYPIYVGIHYWKKSYSLGFSG